MSTDGKKTGELIENKTVVMAGSACVTLNYLISDAGGQGDVYHATFRGHDYALKWYCKQKEDVIGGAQYGTITEIYGEEKKPSEGEESVGAGGGEKIWLSYGASAGRLL